MASDEIEVGPAADVAGSEAHKARDRSPWERVKAALQCQPGIFAEVANDNEKGTAQALAVFFASSAIGWLLTTVLMPVFVISYFLFRLVFAALCCLVACLFSKQVPPLGQWIRAILFATAPAAFGIIPIIGTIVSFAYAFVLDVCAVRDLARISIGGSVAVVLIALMLPGVLIAVSVVMFGLAMLPGLLSLFGLGA